MQDRKAKGKRSKLDHQRKEDAMKRTLTTLGTFLAATTPALAFGGPETTETSLLVILFLGFGAIIIAFQLVPGLILFWSLLKTLFGRAKETAPATGR